MRNCFLALLFFAIQFISLCDGQPAAKATAKANTRGSAFAQMFELAKEFEIGVMPRPSWVDTAGEPLFRFAWLSDLHLTDSASIALVTAACNVIRDQLQPHFTIITGDNCAYDQGLSPAEQLLPQGHRRHLWLQRFLAAELASPYCIIPGDNWPWDFEKVFGPRHYSFDFGGLHFHFAATDIQSARDEGCSIFSEAGWKWMQNDLRQNADKPTLFIMHETLWPATFLDAEKTAAMISDNQQVLAVMSGHLHLDLQFQHDNWQQLVAPAIGRSHRPAFKLVTCHQQQMILESYEWQENEKTFQKVPKWQRVKIPDAWQAKLKPVAKQSFNPENRAEMTPDAKQKDDQLGQRAGELTAGMLSFVIKVGMEKLFGP